MPDTELRRKVGEINPYDGLFYGTTPPAAVQAGTLRRASGSPMSLKRGTVLAKATGLSGDNMLVPLGTEKGSEEKLEADCVLVRDVTVGTDADVVTMVYVNGFFNSTKLITANDHQINEADRDALRAKGILMRAAMD